MKFKFPLLVLVLACLSVVVCSNPGFCERCCNYAPWGIDEYHLLGLSKEELSKKFKGKLFFSKSFKRATFSQEGTGLGYQGAVFNLSFKNDRVSSVQGVFEGCTQKYERPVFKSKKKALIYAINHLSDCKGAKEQQSLTQAQKALAELKNASSDRKSKQ